MKHIVETRQPAGGRAGAAPPPLPAAELLAVYQEGGGTAAMALALSWFERTTGVVADTLATYEGVDPSWGWGGYRWCDVVECVLRTDGDLLDGTASLGTGFRVQFHLLKDRGADGTLVLTVGGLLLEGASVEPETYREWGRQSLAKALDRLQGLSPPPEYGLEASKPPIWDHEREPVL